MSLTGKINLKDLEKLAETAAPDEGRIMPTERVYQTSDRDNMVTVEEAIALLKKRKKDPLARIKGGLDDESDAVRKNSAKPKPNDEAQAKTNEDLLADLFPAFKEMLKAEQAAVPAEPSAPGKPEKPRKAGRSELAGRLDVMQAQVKDLASAVAALVGRMPAPAEDKPKADKIDRLEKFKSGSHKVTFVLNGMEFTVKCLNMVKDEAAHSLVLAFSADADSFFAPPLQSELTLRYDGVEEPGKLYYFGMQFSLEPLGLRFLGFLYENPQP